MPYQPFVGQIMPAGFGSIPSGWAPCDGRLLAINTNAALFSLLSNYYGGDGRTTFALPDLRGRAVQGALPGATPSLGQVSGSETVTLTVQQLPAHTHTLQAATMTGGGRGGSSPAGNLYGTNTTPAGSIFAPAGNAEIALSSGTNITNDGGNQPHNNMQPFLTINYMIALTGIYPSRQ